MRYGDVEKFWSLILGQNVLQTVRGNVSISKRGQKEAVTMNYMYSNRKKVITITFYTSEDIVN